MTHALIIDDNGTGIQVLGTLLAAQKVDYTGIQDPTHIHHIIAEIGHPDVVFLDLEMPHINGYEMLNILKRELRVSAPIIAYSVHTSEITTARELGFDGFLGKPLQRDIFPQHLKQILSGKGVWDSN